MCTWRMRTGNVSCVSCVVQPLHQRGTRHSQSNVAYPSCASTSHFRVATSHLIVFDIRLAHVWLTHTYVRGCPVGRECARPSCTKAAMNRLSYFSFRSLDNVCIYSWSICCVLLISGLGLMFVSSNELGLCMDYAVAAVSCVGGIPSHLDVCAFPHGLYCLFTVTSVYSHVHSVFGLHTFDVTTAGVACPTYCFWSLDVSDVLRVWLMLVDLPSKASNTHQMQRMSTQLQHSTTNLTNKRSNSVSAVDFWLSTSQMQG